ncbi:MAG: hypothetical protein K2X47_02785 [Bdellovibrionales bacterium]|nr:hypothetical protein [Bdellovibrionales bacterium]
MFGGTVSLLLTRTILSLVLVVSAAQATVQLPQTGKSYAYLNDFRYAEQKLNDKIENTDVFASIRHVDLEKQYRPEWESSFDLISVLLPKDQVVIVQTGQKRPPELTTGKASFDRVRVLIHPKSLPAFMPYLDSAFFEAPFSATPLGSYRSLIVWQEGSREVPFHLKVSLDVEIGQARRMLSKGQINSAAITSLILKQGDPSRFPKRGINIIDEPYSVYLKNFEYGFTYRDLPELPEGNKLLPLFSLYSIKNQAKKSLLLDIVKESSLSPLDTLSELLIRPLISHYVFFAMTEGLVSEPHEQNVLVELRDGRLTGRFFYRDLAGFNVNEKYRNQIGKDLSFIPEAFRESLHPERAEIVANFETYLINSNFFAMAKSIGTKVSHEEVQALAWDVFFKEVERYAGKPMRNASQVRKYWREPSATPNSCSHLVSGSAH